MSRPVTAIGFLVVAAAFVLFSPTIRHEFLRYDDELYIYDNPRIRPFTAGNIGWIFTNGYFSSYTPLTLLSHMTDYALWGRDPRGHHLTNVVLHAANAGLLFLVLLGVLRARGSRWAADEADPPAPFLLAAAAAGALAFAVHPLRSESVAWVSDRKDLLLGLFLLASFLAYERGWLRRPTPRTARWRAASVILFACAVLSKSTALVFPAALLAADIWWRRAAQDGRNLPALLLGKWAFLLTAAGGAVAALAAAGPVRFHYAVEHLTAAQRWLLGAATPAFTLLNGLWPARLTPVYAVPELPRLVLLALLTAGLTLLAALPLIRKGRSGPMLVWGVFVLFLLPLMAGLGAAIQPLADRYSYVPGMAAGLAVSAAGTLLWAGPLRPSRRITGTVLLAGTLLSWAALSIRQNEIWRDSVTLWTHASAAAPETGVMTLVPLGIARYYAGDAEGAAAAAKDAIRLEPRHVDAYYLLGLAYQHQGNRKAAAEAYRATLARDSSRHAARINLGNMYVETGAPREAIREYHIVLAQDPEYPQALYNLGIAYERLGIPDSAEAAYEAAHRAAPGFPDPLINLGVLRQRTGRGVEALNDLGRALRLDPDNPQALFNLGATLEGLGRAAEAEAYYGKAVAAQPDMLDALINLAGLRARSGDLAGARTLYEAAATRIPSAPDPHFNLGILSVIAGDSASARSHMRTAAALGSDRAARWLKDAGD